ncbi:MAG: cation diffusion facilitator family transporter, partial [Candidatus Omnitrophica bacterium]|nr:cation diffusion facilitator family transporter [Candidatus Omnitrophota bacterium]
MAEDEAKRFEEIKKILLVILVLNWAVALAKIIYGLITHFTSMTADGFHSLADGASNIIGLIGITLACRPADKEHPYGHKKYETLFSLGIAGMLFFVCYNLILKGVKNFHTPAVPQVDAVSLVVMITTMLVNIFVMTYEYAQGKRLKSDILISDSMHTRADLFTSFSVIAAIFAIKMGYPILDPIVTMMIALFIAHAGYSIIRQGSNVLCDTIVVMDIKKIARICMAVDGVKSCHKIRTRGRIDDIHVDLHAQARARRSHRSPRGSGVDHELFIRRHLPRRPTARLLGDGLRALA